MLRSHDRILDHRELLKRLGRVSVEAMEGAATVAVERRSGEITIAHFLRGALDIASSDVRALFDMQGLLVGAGPALDEQIATLGSSRNGGRPTWSRMLIELMADAEEIALVQANDKQPAPYIRTGVLLRALLDDPDAYACESWIRRVTGQKPWSVDLDGLPRLPGSAEELSPRRATAGAMPWLPVLDAETIVAGLSDPCREALRRCIARAIVDTHAEVTVAHMTLSLLDLSPGEFPLARMTGSALCGQFAAMANQFGVRDELRSAAIRAVSAVKIGWQTKPALSVLILRWFQDGFAFSGLALGARKTEEAALFAVLLTSPSLAGAFGETFRRLDPAPVREAALASVARDDGPT